MAHFTGTETPLGVATTFTGDPQMRNTFDAVSGSVFSDQAGTLHVDQGRRDASDVIHWDVDSTFAVLAGDGTGFTEALVCPLWRVRFVQAGTQTVFRLYANTTAVGFDGG